MIGGGINKICCGSILSTATPAGRPVSLRVAQLVQRREKPTRKSWAGSFGGDTPTLKSVEESEATDNGETTG